MSWEKYAYTSAGAAMLSESISGGALTITRAVSGTGTVDTDLSEETAVSGDTYELKLLGIDTVEYEGEKARKVSIWTGGADKPYFMHQIGVFGRLNDDPEDTLLFLMQDDRGIEIPAIGTADHEFQIAVLLAVSTKANISLTVDPQVEAIMRMVREMVLKEISQHNDAPDAHAKIITEATSKALKELEESGQIMSEDRVKELIKESGGGGGGSHDKDDDKDKTPAKTPDALNGEDHFDYIVGDADGRVHPERNITRAEVASIFFRLLKDDVRSENLTDQNTFTDVSADAWYNVAVSTMSDMDIVFGRTDYQFDPDAYITRAEFAAIAARFDSGSYSGDDLFTDIEGRWAADQINRAAEKGWITGYPDGTFGPNRYITRAEAVTMINRVLNRMPKDKDALHEDMKVFVDNADTNAWYYLAIQEATNSHEYKKDKDGVYETWTDVLPARDWAQYLKLN